MRALLRVPGGPLVDLLKPHPFARAIRVTAHALPADATYVDAVRHKGEWFLLIEAELFAPENLTNERVGKCWVLKGPVIAFE